MRFLNPTIREFNLDTGHAVIREETFRGRRVRMLYVDGAMESAVYLDPKKRDIPPFYYQEKLLSMSYGEENQSCLLIGGGGFTFPRSFLSLDKTRRIRVVELEEKLLPIAREDMFFDECYLLENEKRLFITIGDGFDFLRETEETYDLIINDAFAGSVQDQGLLMPDTAEVVYERLKPGGRYLINLLTSETGEASMPGIMQEAILSSIFDEVKLHPVHPDWSKSQRQNCIVEARK